MTGRLLPPEEWAKLKGWQIEEALPFLDPATAQVWVVEEEGEIVATWSTYLQLHAHGLEIKPEYRGAFGVAKRLMLGMRKMASRWGVAKVITGSIDPHVSELIRKWRGTPVAGELFMLPVEAIKTQRMIDREIGQNFHRQLEPQLPHENHPENDEHNEYVGQALRIAVEGEPERAEKEYNAVAAEKGYGEVHYLGAYGRWLRASFSSPETVVFEVDSSYQVRLLSQGG